MKISTGKSKTALIAVFLIATMTASIVLTQTATVSSASDYGDIMQYPWLDPIAGNPERTGFNAGPAPNTPDVLWKSSETAPEIGTVSVTSQLIFGGKVFVRSQKSGVQYLNALNPFTGEVIWQVVIPTGFTGRQICRIDDDHIFLSSSNNSNIAVFNANSGQFLFSQFAASFAPYFRFVVPEDVHRLFCVWDYPDADTNSLVAYDTSNPNAPYPEAWRYPMKAAHFMLGYGDGKIFCGGLGDFEIYALDAVNGTLLWETQSEGGRGYATAYGDGKVYAGAASTILSCYNATTGDVIWNYDAGGRAFFTYTSSLGYGRIYRHNLAVPNGYVGCWDAETGDLLWKQPRHNQIGYLQPVLADGKLYISEDGRAVAGESAVNPTFKCYDAFTGAEIWSLPMSFTDPAIAYGNLYATTGGVLYCIGSSTPAKPWSYFRGNVDNPGVAVGGSAPSDLSYPKWTYKTGAAVSSSPAVVDGKLYVGSQDKNLYCLDAYSGSLIWNFTIGTAYKSSPAVVGGRVYTGADDGNIYCLDAKTGTQLWKTPAGDTHPYELMSDLQLRSSPLVVGNRLYVGALDGKLYCLDTSGTQKWTYQTGQEICGSPTYSNGVVYIASGDNYLYAIDATTGSLKWKSSRLYTGVRSFHGTPAVADGKVFIGAGNNLYYALNATDGTVIWNVPHTFGGTTVMIYSPVYVNGVLYQAENCFATARNATTGEMMWYQFLGYQCYSSVAYADQIGGPKIYVGCDVYSLTCLDANTGEPLSAYAPNGQVEGSPAIWEGRVYVGAADWNVYCWDMVPTAPISISAASDKGEVMWSNETLLVSGNLRATTTFETDEGTDEFYYPGIPNATVKVSFVKPDMSSADLTATTDNRGSFSVSYQPNVVGNWSWVVWYDGEEKPWVTYSAAYMESSDFEVTSPTPSGGETQPPPTAAIPMEYVYAAVAVIVIVIFAFLAYFLLRRGKR